MNDFIGIFLIAALVLLVGAPIALRIHDVVWFYVRLFTGRLTIKEMRERNGWWFRGR